MAGWFHFHRKLFMSEIWHMPPIYNRVWTWLMGNVQHEIWEAPGRKFAVYVLPGQKVTSLSAIAEGVQWTEYGAAKVPNRKTISTVLDWLKSRDMILLESNSHHTFISIINWHTYNKRIDEKVTRNGQPNKHATDNQTDTNKNVKKEKKKKNKTPSTSLDAAKIKWESDANVFVHWFAVATSIIKLEPYWIDWSTDLSNADSIIRYAGSIKKAVVIGCQLLFDDFHKTKTLNHLGNGYYNQRQKIDNGQLIATSRERGILPPDTTTHFNEWLKGFVDGANNDK